MIESITTWSSDHSFLLIWMSGISVVMFITTLLLVPVMVVRIPVDYFADERRRVSDSPAKLLLKNLLGIVFILAGIGMLFLPGQGILSILIGISLTSFPGKYRLERRLVLMPKVLSSINWLRGKSGKPPLVLGNHMDTFIKEDV
ncbi:MAG: hypothetical protein DRZ90_11665 [Spirochaetes bacterium]|nr:MAG: hypothetical protein DRZ90_11665 [Spirochaetota bacterium]